MANKMDMATVTDIFNRPPTIAEDTLQYSIHPPADLSDKASVTTFAACIQSYAETLLSGFIWHRDAFEIKVVPNPEDKEHYILEGRMRVGDCVDDEWCMVWLLREMSSKWDLVVNVFDSDGEFLLIEAAEALPSWVSPSNSENRVWIYQSRLHLVPLSYFSPSSKQKFRRKLPGAADSDDELNGEDENDFISASDAISACRDSFAKTLAPPEVENIVWKRISGYPSALKNHVHRTKAYIPSDIAKALTSNPALAQRAVETFYTRDAVQLRAAHKMARFAPNTSVLQPVSMTRTAYAQLLGQKFHPPKNFRRWEEREGTKEWRWRDVGMKIAVGFEMLYHESKNRRNMTAEQMRSSSEAIKDSLRNNPEYLNYVQNLMFADYFQGEMEGSEKWKELETKAALTFVEVRRTDDATRPSFTVQVDSAIAKVETLPTPSEKDEDDDAWLNVDASSFDSMLSKTMGVKMSDEEPKMDVDQPMNTEDDITSSQADRLKDLASKVEKFVEGKGDVEGARFEDEELSDEEFSDEDDDESEDDSMQGDEAPPTAVERQAAMDKLVAPLLQGEYGKMPASYSESQRVKATTIETELVEETKPPSKSPSKNKKPAQAKQTQVRPIRQPIIPRDRYDGVDSDDETDEGEQEDEDEEEDEKPQLVGEIEVDMDEEEEEFLEFSRQALGISDKEWEDIIRDRKERGAFLPHSALHGKKDLPKNMPKPEPNPEKVPAPDRPRRTAPPGPTSNPELDSFEAVMKALDDELVKVRGAKMSQDKPPPASSTKDKGKSKPKAKGKVKVSFEDDEDEDLQDIEVAMEEELKAALETAADSDEEMEGVEGSMDYNLIKNFLESFKSQGGLAGPVGNLAGRLQPDWKLPRDQ